MLRERARFLHFTLIEYEIAWVRFRGGISPKGDPRGFDIRPGRQVVIDGSNVLELLTGQGIAEHKFAHGKVHGTRTTRRGSRDFTSTVNVGETDRDPFFQQLQNFVAVLREEFGLAALGDGQYGGASSGR